MTWMNDELPLIQRWQSYNIKFIINVKIAEHQSNVASTSSKKLIRLLARHKVNVVLAAISYC